MPTRPLLQWKSEYETGVSSIDEQHRRLFGYLGDLHDAVEARDGTAERRILVDLLAYTEEHFAHEEGLLAAHAYPKRHKHTREHDLLQGRAGDYAVGGWTGEQLLDFLSEWIVMHILRSDLEAGRWLYDQGVR